MPGTKHTAVDKLSWRPRTESDNIDEQNEVNINDFINAEINAFQVMLVKAEDLLKDGYSKDSWQIA